MNKILEKYLDKEFRDSYYVEDHGYSGEEWDAILVNTENGVEVLVGRPKDNDTWFYHGPILGHVITFFDLTPNVFAKFLKSYLNKKYNLKISNLI